MADTLERTDGPLLRNRFKKDSEFTLFQASGSDSGEKSPEDKEAKPHPRFNGHSVFWIVAAVGLTYYVDFFKVLMESDNVKRWWFNVGVVLLMVSVAMALYCIIYLEWYRGIQQYDIKYPAIPPITTAAFIAASCSFNIALWPVWSIFTPLILFTQFMALVMLISMLG